MTKQQQYKDAYKQKRNVEEREFMAVYESICEAILMCPPNSRRGFKARKELFVIREELIALKNVFHTLYITKKADPETLSETREILFNSIKKLYAFSDETVIKQVIPSITPFVVEIETSVVPEREKTARVLLSEEEKRAHRKEWAKKWRDNNPMRNREIQRKHHEKKKQEKFNEKMRVKLGLTKEEQSVR